MWRRPPPPRVPRQVMESSPRPDDSMVSAGDEIGPEEIWQEPVSRLLSDSRPTLRVSIPRRCSRGSPSTATTPLRPLRVRRFGCSSSPAPRLLAQRLVFAARGGIPIGLRRDADQRAGAPLRVALLIDRPGHSHPPGSGRRKFFPRASRSVATSSIRLGQQLLQLAFSPPPPSACGRRNLHAAVLRPRGIEGRVSDPVLAVHLRCRNARLVLHLTR